MGQQLYLTIFVFILMQGKLLRVFSVFLISFRDYLLDLDFARFSPIIFDNGDAMFFPKFHYLCIDTPMRTRLDSIGNTIPVFI